MVHRRPAGDLVSFAGQQAAACPEQNLWSLVKGIAFILTAACCALLAGGLATEVGGVIG
ncbi:MAG: hypothetical protein WAS07_05665 [Micropruina sp.]